MISDTYINHGFHINQFKSLRIQWQNITINDSYCFMDKNVYRNRIIYIIDEHTTLYGINLRRTNETLTVTGKYYTTY